MESSSLYELSDVSDDCIPPMHDSDSENDDQTWWIQKLQLTDTDRQVLLSGSELTDSLVNAAQMLLAAQYPKMKGFQDTNVGRHLAFSAVPRNCIQIFHIGKFNMVLHVQATSP